MDYRYLPKTSGIYLIRNHKTKKSYIGFSKNMYHRVYAHLVELRNNTHFSYSSEYYKIGYYWYSKSKNEYNYNIPIKKYYTSFNISLYNREKQKSTTIAKIFMETHNEKNRSYDSCSCCCCFRC